MIDDDTEPLGRARRRSASADIDPDLPVIKVVNGELHRVIDDAEEALMAGESGLFQRAQMIVRPYVAQVPASGGRKTFSHRMAAVGVAHIRDQMTRHANFLRWDARAERELRINCPREVAEGYAAREGQWKLPPIAGQITAPTLRADGSILEVPGYDQATALLFNPCGQTFPKIPARPTRDDALQAMRCLRELIDSYPFVDAPSRSVALAGLFTALTRRTIGPAPLIGVTAPTAGSGKSHLVDLISIIATSYEASVLSQARKEEETEKRLAAALIACDQIISLDNCEFPVGGGLMCIAVSQLMIKVRVLGLSLNAEIPNNAALFATGNNLTLGTDMARRFLMSNLDPQLERPELREFKSDPQQIARHDRARYVAAALTCLRAFHVAGRLQMRPPIGSFVDWSLLIRSMLIWLGEPDPCETMEKARKVDLRLKALETVISQWESIPVLADRRKTARELIAVASEEEPSADRAIRYRYLDFRDALLAVAGEGSASISARRLGKWLLANQDRISAGRRIVQDGGRAGLSLWKLELVEAPL